MSEILYFIDPDAVPFELKRHTCGASGFDLPYAEDMTWVPARGRLRLNTGVYLSMPLGIGAFIWPRSGLAQDGVLAANAVIDADYRGQISVTLFNHTDEAYLVCTGDRIGQLVFAPVVIPGSVLAMDIVTPVFMPSYAQWPNIRRVSSLDELGTTERGASGFGSSGK